MSDALEPSLFRRMRYTPVRDALRGRITGRLDVQRRLDASGLPAPTRELIRRVAKRTRLWRLERIEVVDELIAHFADGIAAGETAEDLAASFGDERVAAKLIARAKRRNRGIVWHTIVALRWLAVAMIVFYALSAIYFYAGRPSINVNYVDRLNAPLKDVPPENLAWALYREAIPPLRGERRHINEEGDSLLDAKPGSPQWPEAAAFLQTNAQSIELARQAATRPALGFVLGPDGSARDAQLFPKSVPMPTTSADGDPPMVMYVLLPHLNDLRQLARVLMADARLAREQSDTPRLLRDITAIGRLADQVRDGQFLIDDLVALGIYDQMLEGIDETLAGKYPLGVDDLQRLAHAIARPASAAELVSFDGERTTIRDLIQRLYTDDGDGSGRLTPQGSRLLRESMTMMGRTAPDKDPFRAAVTPLMPVLSASRREIVEATERLFDVADANLGRPMRETDWSPYHEQIQRWRESPIDRVKYAPLIGHWSGFGPIMPALDGPQATAERYLGRRDALIVALALEAHRRQHGQYPQTLEALVPTLLPRVPEDRITGEPLRYRLVDGRPLVYSVGDDRDDDGGRPPVDKAGRAVPSLAARWGVAPAKVADGDWVLYDN